MKKYFYCIVCLLAMIVSGCATLNQTEPKVIQPQDNKPEVPLAIVEQPPQLLITNWRTVFSPMIDELIQTSSIGETNSVLVSDVKNNSGQYVSPSQVNNVLFDLMAQQDILEPINKSAVNQAKHSLGIPYDDALVSRSKMIALARHLNTDYLLFTTINSIPPQSSEQPIDVNMELLLVESGEIVWQFSSTQFVAQDDDNQKVIDNSIYNDAQAQ